MFPAHIRISEDIACIQTAEQHSRNTARYAGECLRGVGLEQTGYLSGLLHDCGKFKEEFRRYLSDSNGVRGSVNHTFAGCRLLLERYHHQSDHPAAMLTSELLALAVGSHHGLFDCIDENRNSGFLHRMTKEKIGYSESVHNFHQECATEEEITELFQRSCDELSVLYQKLAGDDAEEYLFLLGFLARLVLSALIDADRRDTAEFMGNFKISPVTVKDNDFWSPYLRRVEEKLDRFPTDTPISKARREISDRCRAFADEPGGIYRLNVPTGGGKTLSSLRYALAHAQRWGKKRLIFTSPLLSILEQNAAVIREYLEDDSIILEHHSNVLRTEEGTELDHRELAIESWDRPVIITTLVQLLNTLFDGKTTSIRRFQGLINSVIVIDEVQTVPPRMLTLFNLAVDFLAKICGATILLCSATQPCLEKSDHPIRSQILDVIPFDPVLWASFRRTIITDAGGKTLEEIAGFAADQLENVQSLLVVCNRKDEAEYLFTQLGEQAEFSCHLSASMCTVHRRDVLRELNIALEQKKKCLCVATQVIEAGVDISFERVIRLAAGMDSVIQAAGRCNRHGESSDPVPVYVVNCQGEKLERLREIKDAKNATLHLLDAYERRPGEFGQDLSSDTAVRTYYRKLYTDMPKQYQDFSLDKQRTTIFELMGGNLRYYNEYAPYAGQFCLNQALKLAGSAFEVFDNSSRDVIVPYGKGRELIAELAGHRDPDPAFLSAWERKARAYSVSVYDWQLKKLGNAVAEYAGVAVLAEGYYDEHTGLMTGSKSNEFLEV